MADTQLRGRSDPMERAVRILQGEAASLVVLGAPGIGTTAFLEAVAAAVGADLVPGRDGIDDAPFLPLAPLLERHGLSGGAHFDVLTALPGALVATGARLVVDDADHLDPATAALLAQAARLGVPIALGARSPAALPAALRDAALSMQTLTLSPLSPADCALVAADRCGSPLDPPSAAAVWRRSRGIVAVVVDLVDSASAASAAVSTPAGTHLMRLPATGVALAALGIDPAGLGAHRPLLQRLAVSGPLPLTVLDSEQVAGAVVDGYVVEDGVTAGLISLVVADRMLAELSQERRRDLSASSAAALSATDEDRWRRRAEHLDVLAGRGGSAAVMARTVGWLLGQDRRDEALDLLTDGADPLVRARVLTELGRVDDAVAALDEAAEQAGASRALQIVTLLTELFSGAAADEEELAQRVRRLLPRLAPADRAAIDGLIARRRVIRGTPGQVGDDRLATLLRESLTGVLERARADAGIEAAANGSRGADGAVVEHPGDVGDVRDTGDTGDTGHAGDTGDAGDGDDLDHHLRTLIHFLSLVYDGQGVVAREIAEAQYARARDAGSQVLGLWAYNRAKIALHAGQYDASVVIGEEMRRHLAWRDPFGQRPTGEALWASALARTGRLADAEAVIVALGAAEMEVPRARLGAARVAAQRALRDGDPATGAAILAEAGRHAIAHDEAHSGLLGLDEAFWLHPDSASATALAERAESSGLARAFARRASARLADDPHELELVAVDLERMVQPGRAAATFRCAAAMWRAAGDEQRAAAARRRATRLEVSWQAHPWPADLLDGARITDREWEVCRRAATRRRSREIAGDLGLSVRTVDNHLARVFAKLGVRNRDELAEVLGLAGPPSG